MDRPHRFGRVARAMTAGLVSAAMLAGATAPAWAGIGTGGGGVSGSTGIGPNSDILYLSDNNTYTNDNPAQGWGDASTDYALNHIEASVGTLQNGMKSKIKGVCGEAIQNAIADKSDGPATKARVIGIAATIGNYGGKIALWGTNPDDFRGRFQKNWDYLGDKSDDLIGYDAGWVNRVHSKFGDQITTTGEQYPTGVSVVCVAVNDYQPPRDYDLTVSTTQQAPSGLKVGGTDAIHDVIHASNGGSPIRENLNGTLTLRYDGQKDGYVSAKSASRKVTFANQGDTKVGGFTPSDLGMKHWQEGTYWLDLDVPKQGGMKAAINTPDREPSETFRVPAVPPTKVTKTIEKGTSADSMVNRTTIVAPTGRGGYEMTIKDIIQPNGVDYDISNYKLVDRTDGNRDISGQFTVRWDKAANTVSATRTADRGEMPLDHEFEFSFDVTVHVPSDFQKVKDHATYDWNHEPTLSTDTKEFPTWRPNPDKSWIRMGDDGTWQAVIDPDETNQTGADQATFLDGDRVASVVNGTVGQDLIQAPTKLELTDDWSKAAYIFNASPADIRVYQAEASTDRESSVSDIVNKGKDVTSSFTIKAEGTRATVSAKTAYLKTLKGLKKPLQVTMLVPGTISFAHGKGAAQVREDFGKKPGDELTFCTDPTTGSTGDEARLTNAGSETVNSHTEKTNEPPICGWVPPTEKDVLSEGSQGGDQDSIQGKVVYPGQRVEYQLTTEPTLPQNLAYTVKSVAFTDEYDQYLIPDKQTVEMRDLNTGRTIPKSKYTTKWDEEQHKFRLTITDPDTIATWRNGAKPRVLIRFEGTVSKDAPGDHKVANRWMLTLNNSLTPSNEVFNIPPSFEPHKTDTQKDPTISIDGKTAMLGDVLYYRVTLDAHQKDQAYRVWRLGITDDYDQDYLRLDADDVQVLSDDGQDVTDRFNIQDKDGVLYAYARTVDTEIPATGETAKGDPQPTDLKAYSEADDHDPLRDPAIDQNLLGHTYTVVMPMTVIKVTDGYVVRNTATQVVNDVSRKTNEVTNPLHPLNPAKDVTIQVNGDSVDKGTIPLGSTFLYRLDSSVLPADRAYPTVSEWSIHDDYDETHDRYTGQWGVYINQDVKDAQGNVVAAKGTLVSGSTVTPARDQDRDADGKDETKDETKVEPDTADTADNTADTAKTDTSGWFVMDEKDGAFTVRATDEFLKLASLDTSADQSWSLYAQFTRIASGDRIENQAEETFNNGTASTNLVWTRTPTSRPAITLEKYDRRSGFPKGDRDQAKDALTVDGDTDIVYRITNTGDTPLSHITLTDRTTQGDGHMTGWKYPDGWDTLVLQPGQSVEVTATLTGVTGTHTNLGQTTGREVTECPIVDDNPFDDQPGRPADCQGRTVSATDPWNGKAKPKAPPLPQTGMTGLPALIAALLLTTGAGITLAAMRRRTTSR